MTAKPTLRASQGMRHLHLFASVTSGVAVLEASISVQEYACGP